MEIRTIPIFQFPEHLREELGQVAEGVLTLQVVSDGKLMAIVAPPGSTAVLAPKESPSEHPVFWDADTTSLLQQTSQFRLGQMPSREERNER